MGQYTDAVRLLLNERANPTSIEVAEAALILEDSRSPVANKYMEKLFDSVVSKGHIDFDDIPTSKGVLKNYKRFPQLQETITALEGLAKEQKNAEVAAMASELQTAVANLNKLANVYSQCFAKNCEYGIVEYNTYVYTLIQTTSAVLYGYVDYIKNPNASKIEIVLKNNVIRGDKFYFEHLQKLNAITAKPDYAKYLGTILNNGKEGFLGYTVLGIAAVAAVAMSIVPITRELVYQFYHIRTKVSDCLDQNAYFLEMNKLAVESNSAFNEKKKAEILRKQENVRNKLIKIANKLRVGSAAGADDTKKALQKDNTTLTLDAIKREVSANPSDTGLELL